MKTILFLLLCSLPCFCYSQILDSTIVKQVDSLVSVSNNLWRGKKYEEAEQVAMQAKDLATEKLGVENATYAACLHNLGGLYFSWKDKGIEYWEEALALRKRVLGRLHPDYAKTLNNIGNYYRGRNNDKAEKCLLEALEIKELTTGKESIEYSKALYNLVLLCQDINKPNEALHYAQKCFAIRERLCAPNDVDYSKSLNVLAIAYFRLERYDEAVVHYKRLLQVSDKNDLEYIGGQLNLAALYNQIGKYEEAELLALQTYENLVKIGGENDLKASALGHYGNACSYLGRYEEAIESHKKALLLRTPSKIEQIRTMINLGNLAAYTHKLDEAEHYLVSAKTQYEMLYGKENTENFVIPNNLGEFYIRTGRFEEGEALLREALQTAEKIAPGGEQSSLPIYNLGMMYLKQGQYAKAEEYLVNALEIRQKILGNKNHRVEKVLSTLQELYFYDNKLTKAIPVALQSDSIRQAMVKRASGYLSDREMVALLELHAHKNDMLLTITMQSDEPTLKGAAYNCALFYKGFSLESNILLERAFRQTNKDDADRYLQWKGLQRRLANEYAKPVKEQNGLEVLESQLNAIEKQLTRELSGFGFANEKINWRQVQSALKPGEAAIEFYRFNNYKITVDSGSNSVQYVALVLLPNDEHPVLVPLFEEKQLEGLLNISGSTEEFIINKLYQTTALYNLLWLPLEQLLKNTSRIYYSPDGFLHRIAFSEIPTPDGRRLGYRFDLACHGSTRQIAFPERKVEVANLSAAIFGGILYDMDTTEMEQFVDIHRPLPNGWRGDLQTPLKLWGYLPGTLAEANEIIRCLGLVGYKATPYTGEKASEAAFKKLGLQAHSPEIVHVATHGFFFQKVESEIGVAEKIELSNVPSFVSSPNPLIRAGLVFAGGNYVWKGNQPLSGKEDGILTAYEISQLDLSDTKLVVLSACDSGLGDIEGSEGVYGLQRAFRIAGTKQLLMSLWKVPDEASKELMGLFYTYLLRDKLPATTALQKAKQEMSKKYDKPYYWAGFVLVE